jgi:sorbitol-specific phosphotransferase system component IIBC
MKFNLNSIFSFLVLILLLNGCASPRNKQCPDFGGGSWSMNQNRSQQLQLNDASEVVSIPHSILEKTNDSSFKNNALILFQNKSKVIGNILEYSKAKDGIDKNLKIEKLQEKNAKTSIKRKIGRSIGWLSVISGLIGMLNIAFIAFSIMAILIGLLGIKLKISNWGTILSYVGIGFGVLGILSPILNTIVGILILAVLILILLKMFHYI